MESPETRLARLAEVGQKFSATDKWLEIKINGTKEEPVLIIRHHKGTVTQGHGTYFGRSTISGLPWRRSV